MNFDYINKKLDSLKESTVPKAELEKVQKEREKMMLDFKIDIKILHLKSDIIKYINQRIEELNTKNNHGKE